MIGYTYNARGNATSRTSATGFVPNTTPIVVDDANRVRSATVGADTETYTYDGLGRRTRVTTSVGPLMQFYSQAGQPLLWEIPGNEVKTREYNIYLGKQRIARRFTSSLTYVHTDHLGSPLAETTPAPVTLVSSNPHWEPYGAPVAGAFWGGLQFTGHYQDRVTRLTYMQQRYYDPYAGRFLAVDPVAASPGSFNRYWYAANNPYKNIDPDGRYESPAVLLATVPGQGSFDNAMTLIENGNYGQAVVYGGAMVAEQVLFVATLGQSQAATSTTKSLAIKGAARGDAAGNQGVSNAIKQTGELSRQAQRGIRSLERQIAKHEEKLAKFKDEPTVRPGMEDMSEEAIKSQQQARIRHLEAEIKTFKENIDKLKSGE